MIAILADIHANLTALEAVLADVARRGGASEIWCLGDVVGYGPDPHECIARLRDLRAVCVAGNHDLAAAGAIDTTDFNPHAAAANQWTGGQLTAADRAYLAGLPLTLERGDFTLVHGSPREPIWEYMLSVTDAQDNLPYLRTPHCLIGHSHMPLAFTIDDDGKDKAEKLEDGQTLALGRDRLFINPGGVGQPRDGDPRAAYGLLDPVSGTGQALDSRTFTLHRVPYDIKSVQERMRAADLPAVLVARLAWGR